MEKSFGEILTDSFAVFKKSFLPALGVSAILGAVILALIIIAVIVSILTVGISGIQNAKNLQSILTTQIPFLIGAVLFFVAIAIVSYLMYAWVTLIIRNYVLVGRSFFKESFFEAMRKFLKIALFFIFVLGLLAVVFAVVGLLSYFVSKYFLLLLVLLLPLGIIVGPSLMMSFYGIYVKKVNFGKLFAKPFL